MFVIEDKHIKKFVERHFNGEYALRNAVAIYGATIWGLTASELSLVTIGDLLDKKGTIQKKWVLPEIRTFNGNARIIYTLHLKHIDMIYNYFNWLVEQEIYTTNQGEYMGLDPEARLLVNDQLKPFGFTGRSSDPNKTLNLQPSGINSFFKRLIERSDLRNKITYSDFRKSLIIRLKRVGIKTKEILEITGIRDYESVRRVIATDTLTLEQAIQGIYTKL